MRVIYKYPLKFGVTKIDLPQESNILKVDVQLPNEEKREIYMWVLVDNKKPKHTRTFYAYETGEELQPMSQQYIGTVNYKRRDHYYCYHIFEIL